MKNNWYIKLIKRFYGISGELDEYRIQEINRIGNNAFILLSLFWLISIIMSAFSMSLTNANNSVLILTSFNFFTFLIVSLYVTLSVRKLHLDEVDPYNEQEYQTMIKRSKHKAIFCIILFFLVERIFEILLNTINGEAFWTSVFSFKDNLIWLIASIFFGVSIYYVEKKKIKKP